MIRRISKKFLILLVGLLFITLYCEFIIYYVVVAQCTWPKLNNSDSTEPLRAFILADTHLLGPYRGHWLDKWRREWQMKQAFQAVIALHKPDVVFVLGDLFDEGEWTSEKQFIEYVERFNRLFSIPPSTKMYVAVGNHDIGFHNRIRRGAVERFEKMFNAPSVQFLTLKGNHFILINSMAMEGDYCRLCVNARNAIDKIADNLKSCAKDHGTCYIQGEKVNYSQPILMQIMGRKTGTHYACINKKKKRKEYAGLIRARAVLKERRSDQLATVLFPEHTALTTPLIIEGRRIIDYQFFFDQLVEIAQHSVKFGCQMSYLKTIEEKRHGFSSKFVLRCSMCGSLFYLCNEEENGMDVNHSAVNGTIMTGCGRANFNELASSMSLPTMNNNIYSKCHKNLRSFLVQRISELSCKRTDGHSETIRVPSILWKEG